MLTFNLKSEYTIAAIKIAALIMNILENDLSITSLYKNDPAKEKFEKFH